MKPTVQKKSILNVSLTPKEFSVLQATAMGFGAAAIQELWDLSDDDYRITCSSLFAKMGVKNLYMAVHVAFQKGLLKSKEYCLDKVKALALEFVSKNYTGLSNKSKEQELWELYDTLLEFYCYTHEQFLTNIKFSVQQKIPPKRDSRFSSTA